MPLNCRHPSFSIPSTLPCSVLAIWPLIQVPFGPVGVPPKSRQGIVGAYQSVMKRLGHTRGFRFVFKRTLPKIDRAVESTDRRQANVGQSVLPTFILVHKGRKTGREFRSPLSYVELDNGWALAAPTGDRINIRSGRGTCSPIRMSKS